MSYKGWTVKFQDGVYTIEREDIIVARRCNLEDCFEYIDQLEASIILKY